MPFRERAQAHPGGVVDLSMGTPVDPTPEVVRAALAGAADAPGYPTVAGTAALREAMSDWVARTSGLPAASVAVMPTIGSKEFVASLPALLGLGAGDVVVIPPAAYPTYEVGIRLVGARCVPSDSLTSLGPERVRLVWLNSPANPTGRVLPVPHLRKVVDWARERGVVVASDECYTGLGWEGEPPVSVLHPDVSGGTADGLLAVFSLSKRSNLAGYRAGFVAGDPALVGALLAVRRHSGMMLPAPVQAAMVAALRDDTHATEQRERYRRRRAALLPAVRAAGLRVDRSEAGLYLWATRDEECWQTVGWFADRGIVVAPGGFYGTAGARHVRIALTATDERIAAAVERLTAA